MEQCLETTQSEDYSEKLAKAKKLFQLYNDITFGDKIESTQSMMILQQIQ